MSFSLLSVYFSCLRIRFFFSLIQICIAVFLFFSFQSNDAGSFSGLAAGKKHLSRRISFPKAFPDRDRWCPFKRSHGSVLFLVLTTHTDTETRWETHTHADVDTQWCLHLRCVCMQTPINTHNTCKYTPNIDVSLCEQTESWREAARYGASIYLCFVWKYNVTPFTLLHFRSRA